MRISLIAAMASNRVIGSKGDIPWKIPGEQKMFKKITIPNEQILLSPVKRSILPPVA